MAEQKIALVSGANRGIGLEICRQLATLGIRVILGSREAAKGVSAAKELITADLPVEARELDVASDESIRACMNWIRRDLGRLDILVNNAGIMVEDDDAEPEHSSGMGSLAEMGVGYIAYRMSKASLNVVARVLAAETRGMGILVNSADPGWVRTAMGAQPPPALYRGGRKPRCGWRRFRTTDRRVDFSAIAKLSPGRIAMSEVPG